MHCFIHLTSFPAASGDLSSRTPQDPPGSGFTGTGARRRRCGAQRGPRITGELEMKQGAAGIMRRPGVRETAVPNLPAGFDIPIRRIVSARPQSEPGAFEASAPPVRQPVLPTSRPSARLPFCWPRETAAGGQFHAFGRNEAPCFEPGASRLNLMPENGRHFEIQVKRCSLTG